MYGRNQRSGIRPGERTVGEAGPRVGSPAPGGWGGPIPRPPSPFEWTPTEEDLRRWGGAVDLPGTRAIGDRLRIFDATLPYPLVMGLALNALSVGSVPWGTAIRVWIISGIGGGAGEWTEVVQPFPPPSLIARPLATRHAAVDVAWEGPNPPVAGEVVRVFSGLSRYF